MKMKIAELSFPFFHRIRHETGDGAWCPEQEISKDVFEYIQVDLGELKVITRVETQGRFGHGQVSLLQSSSNRQVKAAASTSETTPSNLRYWKALIDSQSNYTAVFFYAA
jgi:hypothetical protein